MERRVNHDDHQAPRGYRVGPLRVCLPALVFLSHLSVASELNVFSVTERDGEFESRIEALIDAPAEYVYAVITDYKHIYRINPSIVESELLPAEDDGVVRVRSRIQHCLSFFCTEVDMVEDVREVDDGLLVATTVPEISSFKSGTAMWHIRPFGKEGTRIQYRASIKPDFFIPPVIGSLFIKANIRKELTTSFTRIECLAKIMARHRTGDKAATVAMRSGENRPCTG